MVYITGHSSRKYTSAPSMPMHIIEGGGYKEVVNEEAEIKNKNSISLNVNNDNLDKKNSSSDKKLSKFINFRFK